MCDEATSHNTELMSLCVRFVDEKCQVREEFIDFMGTCRTTGEVLVSNIVKKLSELNLDVSKIRGQGYDGAASMNSARVGVQAIIKQHSPRALYTHCSSHALNLVYVHSSKLQEIRNMMDKLREASLFFSKSPRREGLLKGNCFEERSWTCSQQEATIRPVRNKMGSQTWRLQALLSVLCLAGKII